MKILIILLPLFLALPCSAEIIQQGTPIETAIKAFKDADYREGALEILSNNRDHRLKFWVVDQGTLIVTFSAKSMKIIEINYHLCDERPKAIRKTFIFDVKSFNTNTGTLIIRTQKR